MFPPCFFSLKLLTAGNAGKEVRWASSNIDGWVTGWVIEPMQKIFYCCIGVFSKALLKAGQYPMLRSHATSTWCSLSTVEIQNYFTLHAPPHRKGLPFKVAFKEGRIVINSTTVDHWTSVSGWTVYGGRSRSSSSSFKASSRSKT